MIRLTLLAFLTGVAFFPPITNPVESLYHYGFKWEIGIWKAKATLFHVPSGKEIIEEPVIEFYEKIIPQGGLLGEAEIVKADPIGAEAIIHASNHLGLDPIELAALMSWESGGTLNPNVIGGDNNQYKGLIQFSPSNQKKYGTYNQQAIADQVPQITKYLLDRGFRPGEHDIRHAYSAILAGHASERYWNRKDSNGTSVRNATSKFQNGPHYERAKDFFIKSSVNP